MDNNTDNKTVFICGAGHQGLSMAAHLSLNGVTVNLWNRTKKNIQEVINTGEVHCGGIISGDAVISKVSTNIKDVITDFVMITTPSSAHRDIAKVLAPYVHPNMVIVLNPGRTFGAIEFAEELKKYGVAQLPQIAETQTIVYACRKLSENSVHIYALKKHVDIAAIQGCDIHYIMDCMPVCLKKYFNIVDSVGITSMGNIGMVIHCAPVLMNIGWIENEKTDFKYYYDGITESIARYIEKIDMERRAVAKAMGFEVESLKQWLERMYDTHGVSLLECIKNNRAYKEIDAPPTINTRYIYEDVPNGLVPIEALGKELGVSTDNISTIINLACSLMDENYRASGRRYSPSHLREYL